MSYILCTHIFTTHFSDIIIPSVSILSIGCSCSDERILSQHRQCNMCNYIVYIYVICIIYYGDVQSNFTSARKILTNAREENNE